MTIDQNTLSVLTVFFIDMAGAILIFLGFICLRNLRGDKKMVRGSFSNRMVTEVVFEDSHLDTDANRNMNADGEGGMTNRAAENENQAWW
jgi:hypothetical protein